MFLLVLSIEHVGVEQHLSCCLRTWTCCCWTTSFLQLDNLISVCESIARFAIADGNLKWLVRLSSLPLSWTWIYFPMPTLSASWALYFYCCVDYFYCHGLNISIAAWIIFIVRKNMWLHSISGASQPLFFCLVAAVDFLMRLHDSTILLTNSWTFWSCEHFIRLL